MQDKNPPKSTKIVLDAVKELRQLDQVATRESVAELTKLRLSIVDDRLRAFVDGGKLRRLLRGIYDVVDEYTQPRPMSCTILSDGCVSFEIGDSVILLTPQEARYAARALFGFADDARVIESTKQHLYIATELAAKVESLTYEVKAIKGAKHEWRTIRPA